MPSVSARARRIADRFGGADSADLLGQKPNGSPGPALGAEPVVPKGADAPALRAQAAEISRQGTVLTNWWLDRMVTSTAPLVEAMTWFWHGHFATGAATVYSARLMQRQNETLRARCLGEFEPLAQAMVVDPAMLIWLNGHQSTVGSPNENLGRELMELFVLGVGHYTENDVKEAARALTGWTVDKPSVTATLVPKRQDQKLKTVLGSNVHDAQDLVSMLVARQDAATFIVGRVWRRFVADTPPPPDAVERLVAAFGAKRNIRALMTAIVKEPLFADPASTLVKEPVLWFVGLSRATGLRPSTLPDGDMASAVGSLKQLGQVPFQPPSVGGWPSGRAWLTTGSALARLQLAQFVANRVDLSSVSKVSTQARAEAAGTLLGVDKWSGRTKNALGKVVDDPKTLLAVAACSPEYVVSR